MSKLSASAPAAAQPLPTPPIRLEPVELLDTVEPARDAAAAHATAPARVPTTAPGLVTAPAPLPVPSRPFANGAPHPTANQRPMTNGNGGEHHGGEHHGPVNHGPEHRGSDRHEPEHHEGDGAERGATGPQLRRFIKSRAYVPMHELRRRFVIYGADDEVTPVDLGERRRVFVGLPEREGRLLGELLRGGDIGYELSLDPISPIVVGVYPMRPVTRA